MQDQAVRDTKVMADRLAARTAGESRWGSTGRGMVARYLPGQEQTGPPKGGGRMRMLGGDSTGEATGSVAADRVRNALRIDPAPNSSPPATQHLACGMVTSRGYMRGGLSGRGRESLALSGG
ncbi:hypothetical protein CVIRNUC_009429 [Coccomyxa viridis]|uniref:Uncharacterized protein n=1 Tax=Coccomyxa viridis TaxID=1274662 RepID=A0AAV1IHU4_9CHLO|nr:hypothetical protein CVIRNUC_009429 [Coccomyxa viridis]